MIDYLRIENKALRSLAFKHGIIRKQLDDAMRFELAKKARKLYPLSRKVVVKIASPKTVCQKWYQKMKAKMYNPKKDTKDKNPLAWYSFYRGRNQKRSDKNR